MVIDAPVPLLFALTESRAFALEVARMAGVALAPLEERPFEEGEFKLRPLVSVRDRKVFVLQSLAGSADAPVAQRLVRLCFLLFALRDGGAAHVTALVPYLAFARKDRRTQPRDPVNSRYVAQLLEATGIDSLVALDVHNPAALDNSFRIPLDHLSAIPMFVDHFVRRLSGAEIAVASPDVGGVKRAQLFREQLERRLAREVEFVFIEKRRARDVVTSGRVVGEVARRDVIVLDDLCASGGTVIRAASALRAAGARAVHAAFTHAPLPRGLAALAASDTIEQIVVTDSAGVHVESRGGDRICVLSVAPLFAEAVKRMLAHVPLVPLLERWPPADGDGAT